jgi:aspartate/methionine/tyrosine aminotransferase
MNPLALEQNEKIISVNPVVYEMLSELGKRIYFPSKGILSQSAEAKKLAKKFNASIGTALESGKAMYLNSVMDSISGVSPNDALLYAPSQGTLELRELWRKKNLHDNPDLEGVACSLPVVTNGLSGALSVAADLFVNPGDTVLLPDMNWDNYLLNFEDRCGANLQYFKFFAGDGLDLDAFRAALAAQPAGGKVLVILNFPNNPTGYTATEAEGTAMAQALLETAERGVNVIAIADDAYYGLFFTPDAMKQSIFCKLAGKHPRLMAVKADAATKEVYVWGLRIGFLTFSVGGAGENSPLYAALETKASGVIRSTISNACALSQKIVSNALNNPEFYAQRAAKVDLMGRRAGKVREVLDSHAEYAQHFVAYPFNSGYFMCLKLKTVNSEVLRKQLLTQYGVGTISITATNLRIAFSCLEEGEIEELFALIYKACCDLTPA